MENNYYYQMPVPPKKQNGMEIAALVLGIIGLTTCCCIYLSVPCGALAIILGFLSQGTNPAGQPASKNAKVAITIGTIAVVLSILLLVAMFVFTFATGKMDWNTYMQELENYEQLYQEYYNYDTL